MPHIFFVEGNIGTGKSTFLSMIEKFYPDRCQVIYEPLDIWIDFKDNSGKNILAYFYEDPKRYAYTFQSIAFISRISKLKEIDNTKEFIFIERSIWADKNVFAKNCFETGCLNDIEYMLYNKWFDCLETDLSFDKDKYSFIYLKCPARVSYERLINRFRAEETNISIEYMESIERQHSEWLDNNEKTIIIDANLNTKDETVFKGIFERIVN